ncbi:unnamed protein product, partial [Urochloa humidicola]
VAESPKSKILPQILASPVTTAMAPSPSELIPDAVEEILLRVPPEEPAHLLRASLVCKLWHRILTDQAFLRRYREFHGTPPLLGFIGNYYLDDEYRYASRFISTTAASPFPQPALGCPGLALDCRHGRVLLAMEEDLLVWDPVTGDRRRLRKPISSRMQSFTAAVLCAAATAGGCDHLDCHGGPFRVVVVWAGKYHATTWASVYSSETGAWSAATSVANGFRCVVDPKRGALVGNVMCFTLHWGSIVMYDLDDHRLSWIRWPDMPVAEYAGAQPMLMEDGSLGLASIDASKLCLWSRNVDPNGAATWVQHRVIGIEMMHPTGDSDSVADVVGFAEGVGIIFVMIRDVSTFTVNLKSGRMRKVSDVRSDTIIPFMSFYTPDRANGRLPLPAEMN